MIKKVRIQNFKSIPDLTLELGRVTVLIGANGSGKSNILEAIALAAAAAHDKLGNEFLASRGIRVPESQFMFCAFDRSTLPDNYSIAPPLPHTFTSPELNRHLPSPIIISTQEDQATPFECKLIVDKSSSYPKWIDIDHENINNNLLNLIIHDTKSSTEDKDLMQAVKKIFVTHAPEIKDRNALRDWINHLTRTMRSRNLPDFLIYSPENSALRTFQAEGQVLPLGIKGEGLFSYLKRLDTSKQEQYLNEIKDRLKLIDWFENFDIPEDLSAGERSIRIRDRFISESAMFDQRSANEGFLYLLFYSTLLISPDTPKFFAIDNIDSSLNPKLCVALLREIIHLTKKYNKQIILTTHNPSILDGLNLNDDTQRLITVDRNIDGHTFVRRIEAPKIAPGQKPVPLSEAFLRGFIGGLPKNF
jgi:predicted ATPase